MDQEEICRTCLCTNSKFTPVNHKTSYLGQSFTITRMIMACAPVEISTGDGLPTQVCEICLKLLYVSFIFRIRILQANEKLKYYLRTKMVPDQQPVSEGFIEPLVLPSLLDDINIKQIFSMLHSTENDTDPLTADPFNLANFTEQNDIKTEVKSEILPIEEVLLSTDSPTNNFELNETTESESVSVNMTEAVVTSANFTFPENISIHNSFHQSQSLQHETNLNIDTVVTDADISNLTETDTKLIQSVIQSLQNKTSTNKNTKFIIINANPTNGLLNNQITIPTQPILKKYLSNTNLPQYRKGSALHSVQSTSILKKKENQTCTKNKDIPSTSQNSSSSNINNVFNDIIPNKPFLKKPESHNFEGELMRFVEAREKYLENRQDNPALKAYTKKKKLSDHYSIDLTNDDSVADNIPDKNKTSITNSSYNPKKAYKRIGYINNYQSILPDNTEVSASTYFSQMPQNDSNKVMRLIVDEDQDQSSSIIIDD